MDDVKFSSGCLSFTSSTEEGKRDQLHLQLMKKKLLTARQPLLGLAEPTITARGTRRLHEENPGETDGANLRLRNIENIMSTHSDFVRAQQDAGAGNGQMQLPRMVQFDLYHIVEAMPETRKRAAHDDLHSFFFREEAISTILAHCQYFMDRQAFIMLMWHTYSPLWQDQNFYEISGQSATDSTIVLDEKVDNPFGIAKESSLSRKAQQALFKRVIEGIGTAAATEPEVVAFRRKLDRIAAFAKSLSSRNAGAAVFRPYHEHIPDGYFWWALDSLSADAAEGASLYRRLFHQTRAYLEAQGVNNLLYAYSPDIPYQKAFVDKAAFLEHYQSGMPDLDQIEVLGIDAYLWKQFTEEDQLDYAKIDALPAGEATEADFHKILVRSWERILQMIAWLREDYPDKIVGLTETGWDYSKWGDLKDQPITSFWQKVGMKSVQQMPEDRRPHFICFWRNDSASSFHPFAEMSDAFSREALAISEVLETQVADRLQV